MICPNVLFFPPSLPIRTLCGCGLGKQKLQTIDGGGANVWLGHSSQIARSPPGSAGQPWASRPMTVTGQIIVWNSRFLGEQCDHKVFTLRASESEPCMEIKHFRKFSDFRLGDSGNPFFHHYQGSIDFNTVNIHRTVGGCISWYPLATGVILNDMIYRDHIYPIHSLLPGVYVSILSLGTVFPRTLPMANIRNTSSRGKHGQCSSNDADKLNVDICRQAKWHYIGCTI